MAAAIALGVLGLWLMVQGTAGRLGARVMSYRLDAPGLPKVSEAGYALDVPGEFNAAASGLAGSTAGTLSIDQVARLALSAGLTADQAAVATAIAMRESGGNTGAHNPVYPDDSYGLWQINRLAWPQFSPAELATAEGNARAMLVVSNHGTNWQPWTTGAGGYLGRTDINAARQAVNRARGGA